VHAARLRVQSRRWGPSAAGTAVAFAIAGASSEHGYLQRLAVDPGAQRAGHGRALTVDALRWMRRRRLPDCLVNTSVDNAAALALYTTIGFVVLPEQLTVLEYDVGARR
jgi:ribosomal protein S18 acetylase RimI-like enzyme